MWVAERREITGAFAQVCTDGYPYLYSNASRVRLLTLIRRYERGAVLLVMGTALWVIDMFKRSVMCIQFVLRVEQHVIYKQPGNRL